MTGIIVNDPIPERIPIYYLEPIEIVAMALGMGEKKWAKAEAEGKRRNLSRHTRAVAYGADVRVTLRKSHDMRPPFEWLKEAKITPDTLRKALALIKD